MFDCDGVLVDSEPHSRRSWLDVLARLGHPGTEADVRACTGLGFLPTRVALERIAPLPPAEMLWPLLLEALEQSFDTGLARFSDALATLDVVRASGIPVAVVSASPRERLDLTLRAAGLVAAFPVSVAGDEVESGKPAPDGYLKALDGLGIEAAAAVAVEDSEMGARAALCAGMTVVAVVREEGQRAGLESTGARVVDRVEPGHLGIRQAT